MTYLGPRIQVVDSPDDGGYYLEEWSKNYKRTRVSKVIYPDKWDMIRAYRAGLIEWEEWDTLVVKVEVLEE